MASKKPFSLSNDEKKSKKKATKASNGFKDEEVLLNLPAGLKYKMPGKRQRVLIGGIVVGLNILFVLAVVLYFYSPSFQEFVFTFGR